MTLIKPKAVWLELLRLLPNVTKYDRNNQPVQYWTEADYRSWLDDQAALGFENLILPYVQYFGLNFGRNMPVYYDYDVSRLNVDWDASLPTAYQFDPIAVALDHWPGVVTLGDGRNGLSLMTLDMYTTLQNFEPKAAASWSGGLTVGSTGTMIFDAQSVLEVWATSGFQIRGRNGGLIQITGWNSLTSVTGTVLEELPASSFAAYDWALVQADPRRYDNLAIADLVSLAATRAQASVDALIAEYDTAKWTGIYTSHELAGMRTFCNLFYTPLVSASQGGGTPYVDHGKDLFLGPGFAPDMNPFDDQPNPNVVSAMQALQDELPSGVDCYMLFQSAMGPRLSIENYSDFGVNVSYGVYEWDAPARTLIDQRKTLYRRYKSHFNALTSPTGGRLVMGSTEETWRMDGPLYQNEYPADYRDVIECLEAVCANGAEYISIYAGPAFMERGPSEKDVVLSQRNYTRTDYRERAVQLWEQFKRLMDWLSGKGSVQHVHTLFYVVLPDDGGEIRMWTGYGVLDVYGNTVDTTGGNYLGFNAAANLPEVSLLQNAQADRIAFEFSGIDSGLVAAIEDEGVTFDGAIVYQALMLFDQRGLPISPPIWYGAHEIDTMTGSVSTTESGQVITLSFEAGSAYVDRRRRSIEHWTDAAQQARSAGDTGLKRISRYSRETQVQWPS